MKFTFKKEKLLHDIANMAFVAADIRSGDSRAHSLHQAFDICEAGNVDRVARTLGLAYSQLRALLAPILHHAGMPDRFRDLSLQPHDYTFRLALMSDDGKFGKTPMNPEKIMMIKETAYEYMVCFVLADWFSVTLPEAAPPWQQKAQLCFQALSETVASLVARSSLSLPRRNIPPI